MNKVDKINEGIIDLKERKLQMTEDNIHKLELVKEILMLTKMNWNSYLLTHTNQLRLKKPRLKILSYCCLTLQQELGTLGTITLKDMTATL